MPVTSFLRQLFVHPDMLGGFVFFCGAVLSTLPFQVLWYWLPLSLLAFLLFVDPFLSPSRLCRTPHQGQGHLWLAAVFPLTCALNGSLGLETLLVLCTHLSIITLLPNVIYSGAALALLTPLGFVFFGWFSLLHFSTAYLVPLFLYVLFALPSIAPGSFTFGEVILLSQLATAVAYNSFLGLVLVLCFVAWETMGMIVQDSAGAKFHCCVFLAAVATVCASLLLYVHRIVHVVKFFFRQFSLLNVILLPTWVACGAIALGLVLWVASSGGRSESTKAWCRKIFHVLISVVFATGLVWNEDLLWVASVLCFLAFLTVEFLRRRSVSVLNYYLEPFRDKQDSGPLLFTPLALLMGFALPVWLFHPNPFHVASESRILAANTAPLWSGLIALGVGDTLAAVVGRACGRHKWAAFREKSLEGSLAMLVGMWVATWLVLGGRMPSLRMDLGLLVTTLVEAHTTQTDNLLLPLVLVPFLL